MHRQNGPILLEAGTPGRARGKIRRKKREGAATGRIVAAQESGEVLVALDQGAAPLAARSTIAMAQEDLGCEVLVMFENADPMRPIIIGRLQGNAKTKTKPAELKVDGEAMVLEAERELVLRCGKSSITLTRAGKVLIRGAYLLSRSSGVNRIKGGSVQIN